MKAMTKSETAQLKAEREAAEAKRAKMTPEEKAAVRKAAQQKRAADMNALRRAAQNDDMARHLSYRGKKTRARPAQPSTSPGGLPFFETRNGLELARAGTWCAASRGRRLTLAADAKDRK